MEMTQGSFFTPDGLHEMARADCGPGYVAIYEGPTAMLVGQVLDEAMSDGSLAVQLVAAYHYSNEDDRVVAYRQALIKFVEIAAPGTAMGAAFEKLLDSRQFREAVHEEFDGPDFDDKIEECVKDLLEDKVSDALTDFLQGREFGDAVGEVFDERTRNEEFVSEGDLERAIDDGVRDITRQVDEHEDQLSDVETSIEKLEAARSVFANLTFIGRLRWLLTGEVR